MTTTMRPADTTGPAGSGELIELLDEVGRLATTAGRPDINARLANTRARLANRTARVVVLGTRGQGSTSLLQVLRQTPADKLPGMAFLEPPPGPAGPLLPDPGAADAVLFVADAGHEYTPQELEMLSRMRSVGINVIGVLTKIDIFPRWAEVQRGARRRLQNAGLDSPTVPLLPVSAAMMDQGRGRGDESLQISSGVPQLIDFLRERVTASVDPNTRNTALDDIRGAVDQLTASWTRELESLQNTPGGGDPLERHQRAATELDRLRQASVAWQIALGDGTTELMSEAEYDLRGRLREVMHEAESNISAADPLKRWDEFDSWLRSQVEESVQANHKLVRARARRLAEQVGGKLAGPGASVPLPDLRIPNPVDALGKCRPLEPLKGDGNVLNRGISSLRGSYSGILMIGMVTSLYGMAIFNFVSVAAGVLLGVHQFWEDRKNGVERRKGEAKTAMSKMMDDVIFQVGDQARTGLRALHRNMRDHFTNVGDAKLKAADEELRAAADAVNSPQSGGQNDRRNQIQSALSELRQLRQRAA